MEASEPKPFLTVDNITVRLGDKLILRNSSWQIKTNEHWAILGPNGSGKSTLVRSLWGGAPLRSGSILFDFAGSEPLTDPFSFRGAVGYVSFETHQRLMEYEEQQEEFRAYAPQERSSTVRDIIFSGILGHRTLTGTDRERLAPVAALLDIRDILERSVITLSSGEIRKTLIARALMKSPRLLILDEPFDGLDEKARRSLAASIDRLMAGSLRVILVAHRIEEIGPQITHLLFVKNGRIFRQGTKEELLTSPSVSELYDCPLQVKKNHSQYSISFDSQSGTGLDLLASSEATAPEILIAMKEATVKYGDRVALDRFTWEMKRGENWAILGPNGSGKSTILRLILGDHLQGYANPIWLFGKRRGSGETLWEIKKHIGVVSPEFQVQYRKKMSSHDVIASGFFDSIGLYQYPTREQKAAVDEWVERLKLEDIAKDPYDQLSYGQKRMILLARAMVKRPVLLILDEPCHGLDIPNRKRILEIIEKIGRNKTHLLYVTHQAAEILDCITHILHLSRGKVLGQGKKNGCPGETPVFA
ncbi:MAG: ATP-binding cassette domain-containing protein [Deltaproteobacteria bacterium]|nr:ATP-binding cassette domain-containing protein [Deltaproteobacteria bacterium]